MEKWLLLDRDGTICHRRHYLTAPDQVTLLSGVGAELMTAKPKGISLVVLTNQSIVGQGLITVNELDDIHIELRRQLNRYGVYLEDIYICLHRREDRCKCRKPEIGLLTQFAKDYGVSPDQCVLVGDAPSDIAAGRRWGCRTVAIQTSLFETPPDADYVRVTPCEAIRLALGILEP